MKKDSHTEVFFDVLLWQDNQKLWRASSPAPYIDPSDYGYPKWVDVVNEVLRDICEEAGALPSLGIAIRVNFIPAILTEDNRVVRAFPPRSA